VEIVLIDAGTGEVLRAARADKEDGRGVDPVALANAALAALD
jgi:hypothetical protein